MRSIAITLASPMIARYQPKQPFDKRIKGVGSNSADRSRADRYRELVSAALSEDTMRCIRYGIIKGLPVGSNRFKADIEKHLGQRLGTGKVGRPPKR